jgi:hypothetical protein
VICAAYHLMLCCQLADVSYVVLLTIHWCFHVSELAPPLDREGMPVQKYVPSYLTKFNPIWFK